MDVNTAIQQYIQAMEQHDYNAVIALFSNDALVIHPIYGTQKPPEFFHSLLTDTKSDLFDVKNIFQDNEQPHTAALYFIDKWSTKAGEEFNNGIVLIFNFTPTYLIKKLTVIFDTYLIRDKFIR